MKKFFTNRFIILGIVCVGLFVALYTQLFSLQWAHGEEYLQTMTQTKIRRIRLTGQRGKILDRNGIPLAYDRKAYIVEIIKDPSSSKKEDFQDYTNAIWQTIQMVESGGQKTVNSFPIIKDADGNMVFSFPSIAAEDQATRINSWKDIMIIPRPDKSKKTYTTRDKSETRAIVTPEDIMWMLNDRYLLPEGLSFEDQTKILSIWQDIVMSSYKSYVPITIARDISMDTVAQIELNSMAMRGIQISESSIRVYPKQSLASNVIGYTGRMTDERVIADREKAGYSREDLVGVTGLESTMEAQLTGNIQSRTGVRVVEVDNKSKVTAELTDQSKAPLPGNDVITTLDSRMQQVLETALAKNIEECRDVQETTYETNKEVYDEKLASLGKESINFAKEGAAVVVDVRTGEVLAMASNPTFDLNQFVGGMSHELYQKIQADDRNPLFNKAIGSRDTPGSIFKMVTGLAGLMEGVVDLNETIDDGGEYNAHVTAGHGPTCWVKPYFWKHEHQNMVAALKNSCNYYFFTVADRLKIGPLYAWAARLGLTSKTGVELPGEVSGQMATQETLYSPDKALSGTATLVRRKIRELLVNTCTDLGFEYTEQTYDDVTDELMRLAVREDEVEVQIGPDIRNILRTQLKIPNSVIQQKNMSSELASRIGEIRWNPNDTVVAGIGQSVTQVTPIGVARYIAALINGGNVNEIHMVKEVLDSSGQVIQQTPPQLVRKLDIPQSYLDVMKMGMKEVISLEDGGTAAGGFIGFPYVDQMGAKTGTAQVSNIDLENNAWFVAFAPFDKPEIAVVVYIPHGYKGGLASYTAREIVQYYMDQRQVESPVVNLPNMNTLVR